MASGMTPGMEHAPGTAALPALAPGLQAAAVPGFAAAATAGAVPPGAAAPAAGMPMAAAVAPGMQIGPGVAAFTPDGQATLDPEAIQRKKEEDALVEQANQIRVGVVCHVQSGGSQHSRVNHAAYYPHMSCCIDLGTVATGVYIQCLQCPVLDASACT